MDNILIGLSVFILFTFLINIWLIMENRKLKQNFQLLLDDVHKSHRDIAGLCSAAVTVDNQLSSNREQLNSIQEKIVNYEKDSTNRTYHSVIEKIHEGADVGQLIHECGISRDEAVLLISLHGRSKVGS